MASDKGIFIKNIFHMLTYAFKALKQTNYERIAAERFEKIEDLLAAILAKGIAQQLKQGLHREYLTKAEDLATLRGKLDIHGSIKNVIEQKRRLCCEYDELSENNVFNQILKTTAILLIRHSDVSKEQRQALRKTMMFFEAVDEIDPKAIPWSSLKIQRNNRSYELLMNICYYVHLGLLQTEEAGRFRMQMFEEEGMAKLYERFILEYFRYHHPEIRANARQIKWDLDEGNDESMIQFLPTMQTDITLEYLDRTLIIDAKYYGKTMQSRWEDKKKYHSQNMYQIFTYVKNHDFQRTGRVSGMLLYAKTNEDITPNAKMSIGGNWISVKTLDLNCEFSEICNQLDSVSLELKG